MMLGQAGLHLEKNNVGLQLMFYAETIPVG